MRGSYTDWFRKPSGVEILTVLESSHKFVVTPTNSFFTLVSLHLKETAYKISQDLTALVEISRFKKCDLLLL